MRSPFLSSLSRSLTARLIKYRLTSKQDTTGNRRKVRALTASLSLNIAPHDAAIESRFSQERFHVFAHTPGNCGEFTVARATDARRRSCDSISSIRPRETVPRIDDSSRCCMRNNRRKRRKLQKEHRERKSRERREAGRSVGRSFVHSSSRSLGGPVARGR